MLNTTIHAMVETLAKSVSDIHAAGGDNVADLLQKSYGEFETALTAEVEGDLAKRAPAPLFKNLGVVGEIANLVNSIGTSLELLKSASGEASPEVIELLENGQGYAEAALHQAVNEHCEPASAAEMEKGADLGEGFHLIQVSDHEDPNSVVVLKTALPEDLAKLAVDPMALTLHVAELSIGGLQLAGIPDETLSKVFGAGGELAKAFPPKKKPDDGASDAPSGNDAGGGAPAPSEGGPSQDAGGAGGDMGDNADPNADPSQGADASGDDPLTVAMRICAALMIQLNHIYEMVNGGEAGGDNGAGTGGDGGAPNPPPSGMDKSAIIATGLRKVAGSVTNVTHVADPRVDELKATLDGMQKSFAEGQTELAKTVEVMGNLLAKIAATPLPSKVPAGAPVDAQPSDAELAKAFEAMSQEERQLLLMKAAQKVPEPRFVR